MTLSLTIKVKPYHDEVFIGYVSRLAYANGFYSVRSFLRLWGLTTNKTMYRVNTDPYRRLTEAFAEGLDMDIDDFRAYFKDQEKLSEHINKYLGTPHINRLQVCPKCFLEQKYVKTDWLYYHSNQCVQHECNLVNQCPVCSHDFNWSGEFFEGCANCGTTWKKIANDFTSKVSLSLLTKKIKSLSNGEVTRFFESLYYYLRVSLRPLDAEHCSYRQLEKVIPNLEDWAVYLHEAFKLYTSTQAQEDLLLARQKNWLIHSDVTQCSGKSGAVLKALDKRLRLDMQKHADLKGNQPIEVLRCEEYLEAPAKCLTANKYGNRHKISPHIALDPKTSAKLLSTTTLDAYNISSELGVEKIFHWNNDDKVCGVNLAQIINLHNKISGKIIKINERPTKLIDFKTAKFSIAQGERHASSIYKAIMEDKLFAYAPNNDDDYLLHELMFCIDSPFFQNIAIRYPKGIVPLNDEHVLFYKNRNTYQNIAAPQAA